MKFILLPTLALALCTGCVVALPFNNRPTFERLSDARSLNAKQKGPISVAWDPANFPERVDTQGASGFVGGASQTRIPTGVAIAARVSELLDASIGVAPTAEKKITIKVISASSKFEYSAGIFNVTPILDFGACTIELEFITSSKTWKQTFTATHKDKDIGGKSSTGILEKAWDDVALQIVREITSNI